MYSLFKLFADRGFIALNKLANKAEEMSGFKFVPIPVETVLQLQTVHEINLNAQYMDASIVITMNWNDNNLKWEIGSKFNVNSVRADRHQVWVPDIEILNRIRDFAPGDEKERQLKIDSSGNVRFVRSFRIRSSMSPSIGSYPYDVQVASLILASGDYSTEKLNLTTDYWTEYVHNVTGGGRLDSGWLTSKRAMEIIHYKYVDQNTEWQFLAYKFSTKELIDVVSGRNFSAIEVKLAFRRNDPFYTMTLILPIIMLTLMVPLGLIMPIDSGEKMGFQVTLLLTVVIYVEYLQDNIPVFSTMADAPYLLQFFVIIIMISATSILGSSICQIRVKR